jgi:integrase
MATVRKRYRDAAKTQFMGFQADYFDQHGKRHAKLFALEREAKAFLKKVVPEVDRGVHTPENKSITVAEAAKLWLERANTEELETSTRTQYAIHARLHINPEIGNVKLAQLTAPMVEKFKDGLLKKNSSRQMASKILSSLKGVLKESMRLGAVAQNVAAGIQVGQQKRKSRRLEIGVDIPTKDDVRRILEAVDGTRWHPLLATAAMTGLRASELRGLQWGDLTLDGDAMLRVRRRADEKNKMGLPKSAAGTREIPLSPWLVNVLRRWRLACPRKAGVLNLVFPNGAGNVEAHSNIIARGWSVAQRKLGMIDAEGAHRYNFHALRHFFASLMIEQNHLPKRVQEMLGHNSLAMTYDLYGHLFPAGDDERAKMADATAFLVAT